MKYSQMITFHFIRRGYPKPLLSKALEKVAALDRNSVIKKSSQNKKGIESVFLITTFSPGFEGLKDIVSKNWGILSHSSTTKTLSDLRVIHGYRRPKNLRDELYTCQNHTCQNTSLTGW